MLRDLYNPDLGTMTLSELLFTKVVGLWFFVSPWSVPPLRVLPDQIIYGVSWVFRIFPGFSLFHPVLAGLVIAVLGYGFVHSFLANRSVVEYYTAAYLGILLVYPTDWRHYLPILPFLIYYFLVGVRLILKWISNRHFLDARLAQPAFIAIVLLLLPTRLVGDAKSILTRHTVDSSRQEFMEAARWIGSNSRDDAVVMSRQPEWATIFSSRVAVDYPMTDAVKVLDSMHKQNVGYVIVDTFTWTDTTPRYLEPAIARCPSGFELSAQFKQTKVFQVVPERLAACAFNVP